MKRVLGKILTGILLALTCGILVGCSDTGVVSDYGSEENGQGGSSVERKLSQGGNGEAGKLSQDGNDSLGGTDDLYGEKSEIMLVERSTNYAWGHHDHGLFVDTEGKIYAFDFSRYPVYVPYDESALTFVERLEIIRENSDPVAFFDKKDAKSFMELGEKLSAKDEFDEKEKMYDYGQNTLYFYQPKTQELLMVKSTGDVDYTPKNKNAKKIAQKYDSYMRWHGASITEAELSNGIPFVYSTDDLKIMNYKVEDGSAWVGKWVLETKPQLKTFAEQSGIPVDEILAGDEYPEYDECTYFAFVEAAGQQESSGNPRAFWIQGNCLDFVSFDWPSAEKGEFVCHFAEVRKEDLPSDVSDILDLSGNVWKMP